MANLTPSNTPNRQPKTFAPGRRGLSIVSAVDVNHTEPVPQTTDNDADTWRQKHQADAAQNAADVNDLYATTRDLHRVDEPGVWATATDATIAVGHRTHKNGPRLAPAASEWATATAVARVAVVDPTGADFDGAAGPGQIVIVRLPANADISQYRIVRQNIGDGTSSEGIISSNRWEGAVSAESFSYPSGSLYEEVFDGDIGDQWNTIVWTIQKHSEDIHSTEFAGLLTGSIKDGEVDEPNWKTRQATQPTEDPHTDSRLRTVEDKTSHIRLEDVTRWVQNPNLAVDGKHPYGGWMWIPSGGNIASYRNRDYDDFTHVSGSGFAGAGSGLIWWLPNNINWSHVRLVVRRLDGSVRTSVTGQSLRNMPSTITLANTPDSPPDGTARWSASSDTSPYAVSNIQPTDTITLEVLSADHVTTWDGEYQDASIHAADLAEDVFDRIDRFENLQTLRLLTDPPASLTVGSHSSDSLNAQENVTLDSSEEQLLVNAMRVANSGNLHRPLQVRFSAGFFLQRLDVGVRTSGFIQRIELYVELRGKASSRQLLTRETFLLSDFLTQFDASGSDTYSDAADRTADINEAVDISGWDIEQGDILQFRLSANGINGFARVQCRFSDYELAFDPVGNSVRNLPTFPRGERDGLVPRFNGEVLQWRPIVAEANEIASRRSISGGWTIPSTTQFGVADAISQSGTTLRISALAALASGTRGVWIVVSRTNHESRQFIPWSKFRTGSGTYVTNSVVAITQGHHVGFWANAVNTAIFAQLDYANVSGHYEIRLQAANTDTLSVLRVFIAE